MSHIFCCANISKHKYKLYARSSRTNSEIIGIVLMILRMEAIFVQYCPTKIRAYFTKAALSAANHIKEIAMRQIQAMQIYIC